MDRYEFRLAEVDHSSLSLYSSVLAGSDRVDYISPRSLCKNVANYIFQSKSTDVYLCFEGNCAVLKNYCDKLNRGELPSDLPELNALAALYPKRLFCVISKTKNSNDEICISVFTYVNDASSYEKCIFLSYDSTTEHYNPLYLYNKTNKEEEKINFKYDDPRVRTLLDKFIKETLKCKQNKLQ